MFTESNYPKAIEQSETEKLLARVKLDLEILADDHLITHKDAKNMTEEELAMHEELYNLYKKWSKSPQKFLSKLS